MAAVTDPVEKFLKERFVLYWHRIWGACIFALTTSLFVYFGSILFKKVSFDDPTAIAAGLAPAIIILVIWLIEHRIPKVPVGKVGILLAISADLDDEAKRIQTDFTRELIRRLKGGRLNRNFAVITLPDFWVSDLEASDDAEANAKIGKIVEKTRGHFVLRGYSKRRILNEKEYHFLKLQALVRHANIPLQTSAAFAKDISALIPNELRIAVDGDAIAFESTSAQLGISTRYTIAIAAAFSGALSYAEELLLEVEQELRAMGAVPAQLSSLEREIPKRLVELYTKMVLVLGHAYHMKRTRELLEASRPVCDKLLTRDPNSYVGKLQLAIIHFLIDRDIPKARSLLNSCKGVPDTTYKYGLAFLLGYEGRLKEAHDAYRMAFHGPSTHEAASVPVQTEEFIHLVIREEPEKNHLLFCVGLINYNAKKDYSAAKRDFEQFLSIETINSFSWAKQKALELTKYCERFGAEPQPAE